uniref:Titin homolog isoform X5 n=1 Tax=Crassostrea virginica TaxID=6565 RepID=A0A8B8D4T1_CRAVI|nr:titin homolog isoform X5 [Crassostrea virginica]
MRTDSNSMSRAVISKHMNLEHLSDAECEKILQVLQKDFELRDKEKQRLHKIEEDLKEEEEKTEVIAVKTKLNEEVCVRCCQKFGIIFNRKQLCLICKHYVCKRCANYNDNDKGYTCQACLKERTQLEEQERELKLKSFDWFYNNVSQKFKRFGSAKVVRSLYKQRGARGRAYHTDNESDSGYDPSFLTNLRSGGMGGGGGSSAPEDGGQDNEEEPIANSEPEIESIGPAPVTTTTRSQASSIETLNHDNKKSYSNNNNNSSSNSSNSSSNSTAEVQVDNIPKEKSKEDIYKEAFEHYKETEEKKFNSKFGSLLQDLHLSLEQPVLSGGSSYGSTSYGEVLEKYRSRLRELLVGVSQRLEMAVESFDSSPSQSATDTAQKVKKIVSKLIEESFGESIDVTSDEAVSDLSSLSDDSCDHQVKSFEDQLAHAVIARVLENFSRERNIDIPLDFIDGNALTNQVSDSRSHDSDSKSHPDLASRGASSDDENSIVTKVERRSLSSRLECDDLDVNESVSDSENRLHPLDSVSREVSRHKLQEDLDDSSYEVISVHDLEGENHPDQGEDQVDGEGVDQGVSEEEDITADCVHTQNKEQDLEELKRIARDIKSPRRRVQCHEIQEQIEFDEEPIQPVLVNREESKSEFVSRLSTYDRLHDTEKYSLPDFSEDYEDNEFFQNEVDPDLLSMNLAPILEEDEDNFQEEEEEEDEEGTSKTRSSEEKTWRDNWIFNRSGLTGLNSSLGGGGLAGRSLDEVYLTIPQPDDDITARVGNSASSEKGELRDVDQMSDDLSEGHEENLMDDEVSFFAKSVDEIARITTRMTSSSPYLRPQSSTSVQTVDSDTSLDTSISRLSKSEPTYIEELIPAEGDDPKFDIPPESLTVKEGEPAKFSCRVSGTEPIEVIWYRVEDGDLQQLEDSEDYEFTQDNNRHGATVFNTAKSMAGQLMCMVINEKAHCSQSFFLKVKNNNQEMKKPEFLKEIEDQEVKEGQHVKFRAKVKGYPLPRVVWYKDGSLLKNSSNYKIEKFGNRDYLLNIDYATPEDDAEYWIVAKNVAGETKSTAQLIVQSKELDSSPKSNVSSHTTTPYRSKDDRQLANMGRKLLLTHEKVQAESESMLESANKLTDMHTSLDQFDAMLSSFEAEIEVVGTSTPRPPPPSEFADEDTLLKHDLRKGVESYHNMKDAASNIHNTTLSALKLLKSTENLINSQPEEDVFASASPRETTLSPKSRQDQDNNNLSETPKDKVISGSVPKVPTLDLTDLPEVTDNGHVTSETVIEPTSKVPLESVEVTRDSLCEDEEEPTVVNFGPKEVSEEMYGRDFYVQGEKKKSPRHWEVKVPQYPSRGGKVMTPDHLQETEEEIYITYSHICHLEEKIHNLEYCLSRTPPSHQRRLRELEEQVALVVAHTNLSEHRVANVEHQLDLNSCPAITTGHTMEDSVSSLSPSLSIDSGFSSIREKPQQTQMFGESSEMDIPESRTEFNEELGAAELPSVNRLKALFNTSKGDDSASVKRFENVLESGVHSITGRSVPKEKLDKYRHLSSPMSKPVQSPEVTPGKSTLSVTLSSKHPGTRNIDAEPTQIFPKKKGEFFPDTSTASNVTSSKTIASTKTKVAPLPPVTPTHQETATSVSKTQTQKSGTNEPSQNAPKGSNSTPQGAAAKGKTRIRAGCINARASFWEKRIQGEETKEEEFPEMVENVSD